MGMQKIQNPTNYMKFFDKQGNVKLTKVFQYTEDYWDISKAKLAKAFGFSNDQIREDRISRKTKETIAQLATSIEMVASIFKNNKNKTTAWFNMPNAHFGGFPPKELILIGKFKKVQNFIFNSKYM